MANIRYVKFNPMDDIHKLMNKAVNDSVNVAYVKAKQPGQVPIQSHDTQNSTVKTVKSDVDIVEGGVSVGTDYSKDIYKRGGAGSNPTGTPKWLEVSFEDTEKIVKGDMTV